jgi:ferrochelatase
LAFFTSAFSSYSGCRQYRENIAAAQEEVGSGVPQVEKLRAFFNHPGFIEPMRQNVGEALLSFPEGDREKVLLLFTAHSIPLSMANNCRYEAQLKEASRLVAEGCEHANWRLVYQSRSGPPSQPWLEPDVCDTLEAVAAEGVRHVVIAPIGFVSDHMEVLFDLDVEAVEVCRKLGIQMVRAATVGTHPRFVRMVRELVLERLNESPERPALGELGPSHDVCPVDCCLYTPRRPVSSSS